MKKISLIIFIILLGVYPVLASLDKEDIESSYNIKTTDILKMSYKEIEIKMMKEGISYKEISNVFIPRGRGYVLFLLPEGKDYDRLEVYDLKTTNKERLVEYNDITQMTSCRNYYTTKKINNTWTILVCPDTKNNEVEIEIDSILYHEDCGCSLGIYYMQFPELNAGIKEYLKEDFKVKFKLLIDDMFYLDEGINFTGGCLVSGLKEHKVYNGVICEGYPNITQALIFDNITLSSRDKESVYREKQTQKEKEDQNFTISLTLITGVIIVFFIAFYQKGLTQFGSNVYKRDKPWKKFLFWIHLGAMIFSVLFLLKYIF